MTRLEENSLSVRPGLLVQVEIAYDPTADLEIERFEFVIVPDEQADFKTGFLGQSAALAQAILGEPVGRTIPYFSGDALSVTILSASPTSKTPAEDIAARRQQQYRQVVEQSERTNAMIFASSFSGKWGDYDPQGIEHWELNPPSGDQAE